MATSENPSVSVVDVDRDGFDDFYAMPRYGKNQFFRNGGDGTFTEIATQIGLDIEDHSTVSIFADFDNDGDDDLFLGRSLTRSAYFANEDGFFVDRSTDAFDDWLPLFVSTATAVDYDQDGLLDLYVGTHAAAAIAERVRAVGWGGLNSRLLTEFLSDRDARELYRRCLNEQQHPLLDRVGPPNLLIHNEGNGRFRIDDTSAMRIFRNTTQATFADYDEDGDPDAYVANECAPCSLFRNEGGVFVDVTARTGAGNIGFAGGVSWGDFDADGDQDIYVSNSFSHVGRRVLAGLGRRDERFLALASGNTLLRNEGGRFEKVSSLAGPGLHVAEAGWSQASRFVDLDNDGWLDVYAPNGRYTAPSGRTDNGERESIFWRAIVRSHPDMRPRGQAKIDLPAEGFPDALPDGSFAGVQANRVFLNHGGEQFHELGAVSGLAARGDGRAFGTLDYDRDGWIDIVLASASAPTFQLFRNRLGQTDPRGDLRARMIAVRLVGGNTRNSASAEWSNRNGYGATIAVEVAGRTLVRELRCGEGRSAQSSTTLLMGLGDSDTADRLTVRWPAGKIQMMDAVPVGTLVTVYENPAQAPGGAGAFHFDPYLRNAAAAREPGVGEGKTLSLSLYEQGYVHELFALIAMTTARPRNATERIEPIRLDSLRDIFRERVAFLGVCIDPEVTREALEAYINEHTPGYRLLVDLPFEDRHAIRKHVLETHLGDDLPVTIITDPTGRVMETISGAPSISDIRKVLDRMAGGR